MTLREMEKSFEFKFQITYSGNSNPSSYASSFVSYEEAKQARELLNINFREGLKNRIDYYEDSEMIVRLKDVVEFWVGEIKEVTY